MKINRRRGNKSKNKNRWIHRCMSINYYIANGKTRKIRIKNLKLRYKHSIKAFERWGYFPMCYDEHIIVDGIKENNLTITDFRASKEEIVRLIETFKNSIEPIKYKNKKRV